MAEQGLAVRSEVQGFEVRLDPQALNRMREDLARLGQYVAGVLKRDVDYGVIPGVPQPFLWEAGADKILAAFNCYPRPVVLKEEIDEERQFIYYIICAEVVSRANGDVVATGIGTASTREGKYGSRWVNNPQASGFDPERDGLPSRNRRVGDKWEKQWRIPNPDWGDLVHTLLQMAYKRAKVDAAKALPGASSALFELFQGKGQPAPAPPPETPGKAPAPVPPTVAPPENGQPEWSSFWAEMKTLGISPEKAREALTEHLRGLTGDKGITIKSIKDDWVGKGGQGRTLADARRIIFLKLGIAPPEEKRML